MKDQQTSSIKALVAVVRALRANSESFLKARGQEKFDFPLREDLRKWPNLIIELWFEVLMGVTIYSSTSFTIILDESALNNAGLDPMG